MFSLSFCLFWLGFVFGLDLSLCLGLCLIFRVYICFLRTCLNLSLLFYFFGFDLNFGVWV